MQREEKTTWAAGPLASHCAPCHFWGLAARSWRPSAVWARRREAWRKASMALRSVVGLNSVSKNRRSFSSSRSIRWPTRSKLAMPRSFHPGTLKFRYYRNAARLSQGGPGACSSSLALQTRSLARFPCRHLPFSAASAATADVSRLWHSGGFRGRQMPRVRRQPDFLARGSQPFALRPSADRITDHLRHLRLELSSVCRQPAGDHASLPGIWRARTEPIRRHQWVGTRPLGRQPSPCPYQWGMVAPCDGHLPPRRHPAHRDEYLGADGHWAASGRGDRKSTRLNSSHGYISYAVFCLKKKKHRTQCKRETLPACNIHLLTFDVVALV